MQIICFVKHIRTIMQLLSLLIELAHQFDQMTRQKVVLAVTSNYDCIDTELRIRS
jgi:hypothetical protein